MSDRLSQEDLTQLAEEKVDVIKTEYLYTFNGEPGYSSAEF